MDAFSTNFYTVNTDYSNYEIEFDREKVAVVKTKDGKIKVVARSGLGET